MLKGLVSFVFLTLCFSLFYISKQKWGIESNVPEDVKVLNEIEQKGVPMFELEDLNGEMVKLKEFNGKLVIINFWASWCQPCVDEFPTLLKLIKHFDGKVVLIAISADYTREDMTNFLKAFDVSSPFIKVLWDKDKKIAQSYGTEILPETYILDGQLKMIRKIVGVDKWYNKEAIGFFEDLVKNIK